MARVKDEASRIDNDDLSSKAREYIFLKKQLEFLEKQQKDLKAVLFDLLDQDGELDSKGHLFLELPTPIEGILSLQKTRRVSRKVNEEEAMRIIEEKGLQDKLLKTIQVVDEDAVMAALYSDDLTEEEIDAMYPITVTWALNLNKK